MYIYEQFFDPRIANGFLVQLPSEVVALDGNVITCNGETTSALSRSFL